MKRVILPLLVLFGLSALFALESAPSDVVGYIQYQLAANDYALVAVPFECGITNASGLATDIGLTGMASGTVSCWVDGGWLQYVAGLPMNDFTLAAGDAIFVSNDTVDPITYYANGVVGDPSSYNIAASDYSMIMVPLNRSDLATVDLLAGDINTNMTEFTVSTWIDGGWLQYIHPLPMNMYNTPIGKSLFVYSASAYDGWNGTPVRNAVRNEIGTSKLSTKE